MLRNSSSLYQPKEPKQPKQPKQSKLAKHPKHSKQPEHPLDQLKQLKQPKQPLLTLGRVRLGAGVRVITTDTVSGAAVLRSHSSMLACT